MLMLEGLIEDKRKVSRLLYLLPIETKPNPINFVFCLNLYTLKSRGNPKATKEQICVLLKIKMLILEWNIRIPGDGYI